jgi:heat-inducible transcriptional repressor
MRILSTEDQEDRKRKLLQAVIHQFIKSGKPVGSHTLAEEYRLDLSPATIRNVLADLETEGFLTHPHTSAGRVPTDKAYRFYVDSLVELQRLAQMEERRIEQEYEARVREVESLMLSTTKTLSALSHYTGFILPPKMEESRLRHIELVPLDARRLLVVCVSDSGIVKQRIVMFDHPVSMESVTQMARDLNGRLRDRPYSEVGDSILEHVETARLQQLEAGEVARQISRQAFSLEDMADDMVIDGTGNILALPDFQDQEQVSAIAHLLDEKRALGEIIVKDLSQAHPGDRWQGLRVRIGAENSFPDLRSLSLISSTYNINGRTVGVLGIIGPKRMEYSRMMSLVGTVAQMVSGVLNKLAGGGGTSSR